MDQVAASVTSSPPIGGAPILARSVESRATRRAPARPATILFVLPYPGYLHMYGSTVRELDARGHRVIVAYDRPAKRGLDPLPAGVSKRVTTETVPWEESEWTPLTEHLRLGVDYARYLDPRFAEAGYLRRRMEEFLPPGLAWLTRRERMPAFAGRLLPRFSRFLERAIPTDTAMDDFMRATAPDAVVVTPLVLRGDLGAHQTDAVKSAKGLRIPVGLAVASWDHLTSKGLIRVEPDTVFVWNEIQRREAVELHGVQAEKVVVTGAQLFDKWFARRPALSRTAFMTEVGLDPDRPYLLNVGSSRMIAAPATEIPFVRRWRAALAASSDPAVADAQVLIRPHPSNLDAWVARDGGDEDGLLLWPRTRARLPMTDEHEMTFFHSLHFSEAVVGINTSAMIEAAIVGRPVLTIESEDFSATQGGTIHYRYLVPEGGGFVRVGRGLEEHLGQLSETLRDASAERERIRDFVRRFVRPHGLERPATPILADAIERLAARGRGSAHGMPLWLRPVSGLLRVVSRRLPSYGEKSTRTSGRGVPA